MKFRGPQALNDTLEDLFHLMVFRSGCYRAARCLTEPWMVDPVSIASRMLLFSTVCGNVFTERARGSALPTTMQPKVRSRCETSGSGGVGFSAKWRWVP